MAAARKAEFETFLIREKKGRQLLDNRTQERKRKQFQRAISCRSTLEELEGDFGARERVKGMDFKRDKM